MKSVMQLLKPVSILLAGDFMLDTYQIGTVQRISPEAPVPIVNFEKEDCRPGGAGNAALNLISLGMNVKVFGRIGKDEGGRHIFHNLKAEGANLDYLIEDSSTITPVKTRIIAEQQQLLRLDREDISPLSHELETEVIAAIPEALSNVKVVALSDYGKGFLTFKVLKQLIAEAKQREIPVIVDPKGTNFKKYAGATLLKPNFSEAIAASGLMRSSPIDLIAEKIIEETNVKYLMITRSKEGISVFSKNGLRQDFAANIRKVRDVTGAGDTVMAILAAAYGNGLPIDYATKLANAGAGIVIEQMGCARVTLEQLNQII